MRSPDSEFDQFLDFLTHLSTELASGSSPEYALVRTSHYFGNQTPSDVIGSLITGIMPSPSLPVLSAMSCSIQTGKLLIDGETKKVTLSRPIFASSPNAAPRVKHEDSFEETAQF